MSSPTSPTSTSTFPSSPPSRKRPRVSAEHTLTRVRENQRRHRARRKDYIASLEQRLADAEAQLEAARAEIASLKGERERGMGPTEEYRDGGVQGEMLALERMVDGGLVGAEVMFEVENMTRAGDTTTLEASEEVAVTAETGPPPCCEDQSAQVARVPESVECSECHTRPAPAPTESTTLCARAYVLIAQQNFRGIDAGTIRLWLYQGYRRARREGEGCRVENGALFRLLDYISGV